MCSNSLHHSKFEKLWKGRFPCLSDWNIEPHQVMVAGLSGTLLIQRATEEPSGVKERRRCRVVKRLSFARAEEGWGCFNPGKVQAVKDLFNGCEKRFFDLVAYHGHVVSVQSFAGTDVYLKTVTSIDKNNLARCLRHVERDDIV